ncbi:hypothetical protein [Nostoc sp. PCC 7107]|uniref:hypothetical protein n=1 Tax=Nostoc sp. PCC 7107 TaxID=317936 RepID=UPI00029F2EAD|nr:hypothetical protein [Nostoc sp. PCC 7107]AFY45926.1 hypothetical protein Nos7107_5444 [Nostoc sp. PCC 7107]
MEGSVSSSASQPPGESPWKIAAKVNNIAGDRQYVQSLGNLLKADPVVRSEQINITYQTGTLQDSQERSHSVIEAAITDLNSLIRSANEATAGIFANPTSRI